MNTERTINYFAARTARRLACATMRRTVMTLLVLMMAVATAWAQNPQGSIEVCEALPSTLHLKGWAYDPLTEATSIKVTVELYMDEACTVQIFALDATADVARSDVAALEGITGNHGFECNYNIEPGKYWVKVYANNAANDDRVQIGETTKVVGQGLTLGDTQVTTSNMENILGDGKASYDPATHTLTLNDPAISFDYGYGIIAQNMDLTVTGTWHMTEAALNCGIYVDNGNLTLDGNFTLKGGTGFWGIFISGTDAELTIASGSTIFASGGSAGISCANIIVCDGVRKIEAQSLDDGSSAFYGKFSKSTGLYGFPDGYGFIVPFMATVGEDGSVCYNGADETYILIGCNTSYGICFGNTLVTPTNKDDILGDGKATYDPETSTLTLNEPGVTNMYRHSDYGYCSLYVVDTDITITGAWHMDADNDRANGILVEDGNVTLDGDFKFVGATDSGIKVLGNGNLTLKGNIEAVCSGTWGICSEDGSITVSSGHLKATGICFGIAAQDVTIENSVTKVELDGSTDGALYYAGNLTLGEGITITAPLDGLPYLGRLFNLDGDILKSAVIEPSDHPIPQVPGVLVDLGWLGETKVNSWNVNARFDGKVSFNYETKTLTLDNPTISGVHNSYKIYITYVDYTNPNLERELTIAGCYHMTEAESGYGFLVDSQKSWFSTMIFDGDFTFYGSSAGIGSRDGTIVVKSGTLTFNDMVADNIRILGGTVNLNSNLGFGMHAHKDIIIQGGTINGNPQLAYDFLASRDIYILGGEFYANNKQLKEFYIQADGNIYLGWTNEDDYIYCSPKWYLNSNSFKTIADKPLIVEGDRTGVVEGTELAVINGKRIIPFTAERQKDLTYARVSLMPTTYDNNGGNAIDVASNLTVDIWNGDPTSSGSAYLTPDYDVIIKDANGKTVTTVTQPGHYTLTVIGTGDYKGEQTRDFDVIGAVASVTFAKEGYGTYYNSSEDVVLPSGVKAYVVTASSDGGTLTYEVIADGSLTDAATAVVPKATAVMLKMAESDATQSIDILLASPTAAAISQDNLLHGSDVAVETTGGGAGAKYYKLTYGLDNTSNGGADNSSVLGWYWGADGGAAFTSGAHKAWLALPPSTSFARGFFGLPGDGETTGICPAEIKETAERAGVWYSLDGRKLNGKPSAKGVYIVGGKKVVIK